MKKNIEQKRPISLDKLNAIIKKWKINLGILSAETGIAKSTLANMLNPKYPQYYMDDQQYFDVISAIGRIGISQVEFFKKAKKNLNPGIYKVKK
jgi:hypothetical protein